MEYFCKAVFHSHSHYHHSLFHSQHRYDSGIQEEGGSQESGIPTMLTRKNKIKQDKLRVKKKRKIKITYLCYSKNDVLGSMRRGGDTTHDIIQGIKSVAIIG
jgi:hypothetical protein